MRLRAGLKAPPDTLPPLLQRCRAGLGLKVVLSAAEWGKIESVDVRLLAGDISLQVSLAFVGRFRFGCCPSLFACLGALGA